jgi:pyruvate/2-oxoacid:ferredoxin oxidoreductase beta subunit
VLASGRNVNVLVLDTEVYSYTGGQAPEGDAAGRGRQVRGGLDYAEKDLAMQAIAYGNVCGAG